VGGVVAAGVVAGGVVPAAGFFFSGVFSPQPTTRAIANNARQRREVTFFIIVSFRDWFNPPKPISRTHIRKALGGTFHIIHINDRNFKAIFFSLPKISQLFFMTHLIR
jgi:hypothetical protein